MVPTAKPIADFHRQAIAHAGRTQKRTTILTENDGSFCLKVLCLIL